MLTSAASRTVAEYKKIERGFALLMTATETTQDRKPILSHWRRIWVNVLLLAVSVIWGSTFLVVKDTVKITGPFTFLALRFGIGAIVLALVFYKRLARIKRDEILPGLAIGLFLFLAYSLQTLGLQYTTVSKAGFITGLYIPLVPLFSLVLLRQRPRMAAIVGVVLSFIGLGLLSVNNQFNLSIGLGELLILGCAVGNALHIVSISKFAPHADAINLAIVQMALTALLSVLAIPLTHEPLLLPSLTAWAGILFMGIVATAFCIAVMNWAQQRVSSTKATLIYAMEPMWSGLFGYLVGETLSLPAWFGCGFIFLSMIIGEVHFPLRRKGNNRQAALKEDFHSS
jgi:drug/metabolite transporter (DMT)-like permease